MTLLKSQRACYECGEIVELTSYQTSATCPTCTEIQRDQAKANNIIREARVAAAETIAEKEREFAAMIRDLKAQAEEQIRMTHVVQFSTVAVCEEELASRMPKIYTEGDLIVEFARPKDGAKGYTIRYWSVRSVGRVPRSRWSDYNHNAVFLRSVKSGGELGERKGSARWDMSTADIDGSGGINDCFAVFRRVDGEVKCVYQQLDGVESYYPKARQRYSYNPPLTDKEKADFRAKAEAILADTATIAKNFPKE